MLGMVDEQPKVTAAEQQRCTGTFKAGWLKRKGCLPPVSANVGFECLESQLCMKFRIN
jgi:hypothetical protein